MIDLPTYFSELTSSPGMTAESINNLISLMSAATTDAWAAILQDSARRKEFGVRGWSRDYLLKAASELKTQDVDRLLLGRLVKEHPEAQPHFAKMVRYRDRVVTANVRLVLKAVKPWVLEEAPDLVQDGMLGLMKAVYRFDPTAGTVLSTYATPWIKQAVARSVVYRGRTLHVPEEVMAARHKISKLVQATDCSSSEAAAQLGISVEMHDRIMEAPTQSHSLNALIDGDEGEGGDRTERITQLQGVAHDHGQAELDSLAVEEVDRLRKVLSPIERDWVRRDNEEETFASIAELYQTTRDRVRQVVQASHLKIQRAS